MAAFRSVLNVLVLDTLKRGKAVGVGGLSCELLCCASEEALYVLFEAIREDLKYGAISGDWKRVLYVLLPKPGNDPALVCERPEIALMAVDLKLVMQMIRWSSTHRTAGWHAVCCMLKQAGWLV